MKQMCIRCDNPILNGRKGMFKVTRGYLLSTYVTFSYSLLSSRKIERVCCRKEKDWSEIN